MVDITLRAGAGLRVGLTSLVAPAGGSTVADEPVELWFFRPIAPINFYSTVGSQRVSPRASVLFCFARTTGGLRAELAWIANAAGAVTLSGKQCVESLDAEIPASTT